MEEDAMEQYPCVARNPEAFIGQVVKLVSSGHYFYVRCVIKKKKDRAKEKDPREVDRHLLELYDIARPRWRRERRRLKGAAGIHYLRHERTFVLMVTKGRHDKFYEDHGRDARDIRVHALKVFGYSIRYTFSKDKKRWSVFVRLDKETYRGLKHHMLTICTWESYRDKERMEREFERLRFDMYGPVFKQVLAVARAVNRERRRRGFRPIDYSCIPHWRRVQKVFSQDECQTVQAA
jgi:hypothetical protein